jgi:hypothetical protein
MPRSFCAPWQANMTPTRNRVTPRIRGACARKRSITFMTRSAVAELLFSIVVVMLLPLLLFQFAQIFIQPVEALLAKIFPRWDSPVERSAGVLACIRRGVSPGGGVVNHCHSVY